MIETLVSDLARGKEIWDQLALRWQELKLPGSKYSPQEMFICLVLSGIVGDAEDVAARVRDAKIQLDNLRRNHLFPVSSLDAQAILLLAVATLDDPARVIEPQVLAAVPIPDVLEPAEVANGAVMCPSCGHDSVLCSAGEYAQASAAAPPQEAGLNLQDFVEPADSQPSAQSPEASAVPASEAPIISIGPEREDSDEGPLKDRCCHVDMQGKCINCTQKDTTNCANCGEEVVEESAWACQDKDCDKVFCEDCKDGSLNAGSYCDDCAVVECDNCGEDVDRGEIKSCVNENCENSTKYCPECAPRLLTSSGLCDHCADEQIWDCDGCGEEFVQSRLTECRNSNCNHVYCKDCRRANMNKGYCSECGAS